LLPAIGGIVLGAAGYISGYLGPLQLNPDASLGPFLGIFFTGPAAFALGVLLGLLAAALPLTRVKFVAALVGMAVTIVIGTLYLSLPDDRYLGFVIVGEIQSCGSPLTLVDAAVTQWENWNAEDSAWRTPRARWKEDTTRLVANDRGVVITMRIHERLEFFEQRKPWNRGRRYVQRMPAPVTERYFARNQSCSDTTPGHRALYAPEWEASTVSPPDILPTFLGLYVLKPVPDTFRELISRKRRANSA
jgi:hypothetical protein